MPSYFINFVRAEFLKPMSIRKLFQSLTDKKIFILLNTGNRGDGLIHMGGRALLETYGVSYQEIQTDEDVSGQTLLVYGCGGFCVPYHHNIQRVDFYVNRFDKIYILPSSFDLSCEEVKQFIARLPKKIIVYCRERYSFEQVKQFAYHPENIFLDSDLAFYVDYSQWRGKGRGTLLAFRRDSESAVPQSVKRRLSFLKLRRNKDVSKGPTTQGEYLLSFIARYREVFTDRAHVAIAAAMMGKETYVFPNSYHKVKGIYEYSLADFTNVHWMGQGQNRHGL